MFNLYTTMLMALFNGIFSLFLTWLIFKRAAVSENLGEKPEGFSLIIPFFNEEDNLEKLLKSLSNQNSPIPFEVILVDDNSTDRSYSVIEETLKGIDLSLHLIKTSGDNSSLTSKQRAMECGVKSSHYDWLIFTDADMVFKKEWLKNIYKSCWTVSSPFVYGRTGILRSGGFFQWFQEMQLNFLFLCSWLLTKAQLDSSCMGNNIAIYRNLYTSIGGQAGIGPTLVEDKKLYSLVSKTGIKPATTETPNIDAYTHPLPSINSFIHQQLRWLKGGLIESLPLTIIIALFTLHLISTLLPIFWSGVVAINWLLLTVLLIKQLVAFNELKRIHEYILYLLLTPIEALLLLPLLPFWKLRWKRSTL